jgi:hypothetical protein
VLTVAGAFVAAAAFATSVDLCTTSLGCDSSASLSGAALLVAIVGVVALLAAPYVAARLSHRPAPGATAALAIVGVVIALVIGGALFEALVGTFLPAPILALAVEGAIAVRPPSRKAVWYRAAAVATLLVLALVLAPRPNTEGTILLLAALTLPAISAADSASRWLRR